MKLILMFCISINLLSLNACSQTGKPKQPVGGSCEGCEAVFESPVAFEKLSWEDTLPDFNEPGPKMMISGIVYQADGKTPAKDVVLYIYHTDQSGKYSNKNNEKGDAGRHGYIKGWIKTNEKGAYKFYTLKPASYPGGQNPAHIHPIIKEPNFSEYWIVEFLFEDDPVLTDEERKRQPKHGGSGIISLTEKDGILYGERNIYLGKNIPGYQ